MGFYRQLGSVVMQMLGSPDPGSAAPQTAPTSLSAIPTSTNVAISFTAPSNDGGSPITNYEYSFNNSTWTALSPAEAVSPVTVSGLSANTSYSIYLRAVNVVGSGPASSAVSFTTDFATFGSVEYLSINGGATSSINGGNHGTWYQGSQTLLIGSGIVVTVGAAGGNSTCGNMSAATVYSYGAGSGGSGANYNIGHNGGAGGGGAGGTGGNGSGHQGGNGGPGRSTSITGSAVTLAGGGGGQGHRNGGGLTVATGGSGGGGNGEYYSYGCAAVATAGAVNSGSGGGGTHECGGGGGGSGRVTIAYPSAYGALTTIPAGLTYSLSTGSRAGYHVYSFTGGTGTVIP